jgi:DNA-binding IclR family transcriptional regulator
MADPEIASDVRRLLDAHVETYAQLEVLIRLASDCDRHWTIDDLAHELAIPVASVREAVDHLLRSGLIERSDQGGEALFTCRAHREVLPLLESLAEAYRVNRLAVVNLMNANALERMRTAAMRAFARAFQIGTRDDG